MATSEKDYRVDVSPATPTPVSQISNIITDDDRKPRTLTFDIDGKITGWVPVSSSEASESTRSTRARLILPSLAHPHVHLDKPYLLSHADTSQLKPESGSFQEALDLTAKAKPLYTRNALLERGAQLLADSSRAGVTHLRGFCEVDTSVGLKCIEAGVTLKTAWEQCLYVQVAAFAQDPLFSTKANGTGMASGEDPSEFMADGNENLRLLKEALRVDGVEVLATTPYVEASLEASRRNIDWAISSAIETGLHLDFHLDYNLDTKQESLVWHVLDGLRKYRWVEWQNPNKTVCLGHCTRLTLFSAAEWERLAKETAGLPVYFIGLPTSDLFMQGRADTESDTAQKVASSHNRPRSTIHVPSMLKHGLKAAVGINNLGNAFTPFGTADPLQLATCCIGTYQDGTADAAKTLYQCVSNKAKEAMGLASSEIDFHKQTRQYDFHENEEANLIVFGTAAADKKFNLQRRSMAEVIWNPPPEHERMVIYKGKHIHV